MDLVARLRAEAQLRKDDLALAALLIEAADALTPKTMEQVLEECRKWRLTDEEVDELLK